MSVKKNVWHNFHRIRIFYWHHYTLFVRSLWYFHVMKSGPYFIQLWRFTDRRDRHSGYIMVTIVVLIKLWTRDLTGPPRVRHDNWIATALTPFFSINVQYTYPYAIPICWWPVIGCKVKHLVLLQGTIPPRNVLHSCLLWPCSYLIN